MSRKVKNMNPLVNKTCEESDIQNVADAQDIMKDIVSLILEAEIDDSLGYSKYDRNITS